MLWEGESVVVVVVIHPPPRQGCGPMGVAHAPGDGLTPMPTWVSLRLVQLSGLLKKLMT